MNKSIITVVGKDTIGIIAKVCTYLADNKVNILDISQTIVQEYFNMMMIVDMSAIENLLSRLLLKCLLWEKQWVCRLSVREKKSSIRCIVFKELSVISF